jgi:hypothetical protein
MVERDPYVGGRKCHAVLSTAERGNLVPADNAHERGVAVRVSNRRRDRRVLPSTPRLTRQQPR